VIRFLVRCNSRVGRVGVVGTLAVAAAFGAGVAVPAQTVVGTLSTITTIVNIPGQLPTGVTGYRVEYDCNSMPGYQDGLVSVSTFPTSGGTVSPQFPLANTTSCKFRLFVLGTGVRSIFGNAVYIGGSPRSVTYPTLVNGVTYDANTVLETEQVPIIVGTTVIFGSLPVVTSTTLAATTTTTTRPPTTTVAPTTTRPTTTTSSNPPVVPPTTSAPAPVGVFTAVRVGGVNYVAFASKTCASRVILYKTGSTLRRCATASQARSILRIFGSLPTK
jgi:hypothetical protein